MDTLAGKRRQEFNLPKVGMQPLTSVELCPTGVRQRCYYSSQQSLAKLLR